MKKLFIILAVVALVMGCNEPQPSLFMQAWKEIEEDRPRAAKEILSKVRPQYLSESSKVEYELLKTIVAFNTFGWIENDSIISASIAYYNKHGDDWHRGRAYYYRGVVRMHRFGNVHDAVKDFKVAEIISEKADDEELKNLIYQKLIYANIFTRNHPLVIRYSQKLLDSSIELKDTTMILRSLRMCASAYTDINQMDSAYTYMMKGLELKEYADRYILADIYSMLVTMYEEKGDTAKAEEYLKKLEETNTYTNIVHPTQNRIIKVQSNTNLGYLTQARMQKAQGQYEEAIRLAKLGLTDRNQKKRMKCMELLSELYELTDSIELAIDAEKQVQAYNDSMKYVIQAKRIDEWQQRFDEVQQTKELYHRLSGMQGLIIALIVVVVFAIVIGMWWHRRKVRKLSFRLDEDARRISELRTKIDQQEKSGEENGQEMARLKEELESRMERISGTLLIGTQMYNQLQQRQCIAEATAKELQCLVDYFAQLRPKRWQEWERKYKNLSTAQYVFLIMQDDLHYDDEAIATALNVKRTSVRSMRSRIKERER